jgi:hypothetical protein
VRHIGVASLFAAAAALLVLVGCGRGKPGGNLEATLPLGRYRISIVWTFSGDPSGPPSYQCGSRRVTIRRNVRVDVFVNVESRDRCPIELAGAD